MYAVLTLLGWHSGRQNGLTPHAIATQQFSQKNVIFSQPRSAVGARLGASHNVPNTSEDVRGVRSEVLTCPKWPGWWQTAQEGVRNALCRRLLREERGAIMV